MCTFCVCVSLVVSVHLVLNMSFVTYSKNVILLTVLLHRLHLKSYDGNDVLMPPSGSNEKKPIMHTVVFKRVTVRLKEDERDCYSGQKMVFHNWLWE